MQPTYEVSIYTLYMRKPKILAGVATLALIYNVIVVLSVTLNLTWVEKFAAGGQLTNFPLVLRIIYGFLTLSMVFLLIFLWDLVNGTITVARKKTARILALIFFISTFTQLISRSELERWNAIPALIIAYTFWVLSRNTKA
jgi:hypothetical protein